MTTSGEPSDGPSDWPSDGPSHRGVADQPERWTVVGSEDVYRTSAPFAVRLDQVAMPGSDETFERLVLEHPGAVVVLAVDDRERVLVLKQYRHPAETRFVELPAGLLDVPGEDPEVAARRELLEEAGLEAQEWTRLSSLWSSPGISAEQVHTYVARGLTERPDRGGFVPRHEEADMTTAWVSVSELLDGVLAGRVTDTPLAVAVLLYSVRGAR